MVCPLDSPEAGKCHWCRKPLRGRQTRWCSRLCAAVAVYNHRWTQAKARKKKSRMQTLYECERCEKWVEDVEVNHIEPCIGKHGQWGCHHHQDNLEVLCKPCHKETTAEQRAAGKFPTRTRKGRMSDSE